MSLTETRKEKIIEAQKKLASYQFQIRQDQLDMIKKKFNTTLLHSLRKGVYHAPVETEEEEVKKEKV